MLEVVIMIGKIKVNIEISIEEVSRFIVFVWSCIIFCIIFI